MAAIILTKQVCIERTVCSHRYYTKKKTRKRNGISSDYFECSAVSVMDQDAVAGNTAVINQLEVYLVPRLHALAVRLNSLSQQTDIKGGRNLHPSQ